MSIHQTFDSPYGTSHREALDKAVQHLMQISHPVRTNWSQNCGGPEEVAEYYNWQKWCKASITRDDQKIAFLGTDLNISIENNMTEPVYGNLEGHAIQLVQSPRGYHLMTNRVLANDGEWNKNGSGNRWDGLIWTNQKTGEPSQNIWVPCSISVGKECSEMDLRQLLTKLRNHSMALREEQRNEHTLWDVDLTQEEESLKKQGLGFLIADSESARNKRNPVPESMSEERNIDHPVNEEWREQWTTSDDEVIDSLDF